MSQVIRCDDCQYCDLERRKSHSGLGYYCRITGKDITQSHFGMNSPKSCPRRKVEFECNFSQEYYEEMESTDLPIAACLWLENGWQGVEYNLCFDKRNGTNSSAIYKMDAKADTTFSWIYEHYEVDFSDAKWEEKLKNIMETVARKFWKTEGKGGIKVEDLKKWIGKKFTDFCQDDPEDEREIHYTLTMKGSTEEEESFTSAETVSKETMHKIRSSVIKDLSLSDNWWHVSLEYEEDEKMRRMKKAKLEQALSGKDGFREFCAEIFPHLEIVADALEKYKKEGKISVKNGASIYITPDGYISMSEPGGWELLRLEKGSEVEIRYEIKEKL